jgi:hypothetical protein
MAFCCGCGVNAYVAKGQSVDAAVNPVGSERFHYGIVNVNPVFAIRRNIYSKARAAPAKITRSAPVEVNVP